MVVRKLMCASNMLMRRGSQDEMGSNNNNAAAQRGEPRLRRPGSDSRVLRVSRRSSRRSLRSSPSGRAASAHLEEELDANDVDEESDFDLFGEVEEEEAEEQDEGDHAVEGAAEGAAAADRDDALSGPFDNAMDDPELQATMQALMLDPEEMDHLLALSLSFDEEQMEAMTQPRLVLDESGPARLSMPSDAQVYMENWASGVDTNDLYNMERVFTEFAQQNARLIEADDGTQSIAIEGNLSFEDFVIPAFPPLVTVSGDLSFRNCTLPEEIPVQWTSNKLVIVNCRGNVKGVFENFRATFKKASNINGLQSLMLGGNTSSAERPVIIDIDTCADLERLEAFDGETVVLKKLKIHSCPGLTVGPDSLRVLQNLEFGNLPLLSSIGRKELHLGTSSSISRCPQLKTLCDGDMTLAGSIRIENGKLERLCEGILRWESNSAEGASGASVISQIDLECVDTDTPIAARIDAPHSNLSISGENIPAKLCEGSIVVNSLSVVGPYRFHEVLLSHYPSDAANPSSAADGQNRADGDAENFERFLEEAGVARSSELPGLLVDELELSDLFRFNVADPPPFANEGPSAEDPAPAGAAAASPTVEVPSLDAREPLSLRDWMDDVHATASITVTRLPIKRFRGVLTTPELKITSLPLQELPEWRCDSGQGVLKVKWCPAIDVLWSGDAPPFSLDILIEDCNNLERLSMGEIQLQKFTVLRAPRMERLAKSVIVSDNSEIRLTHMNALTRISDEYVTFKEGLPTVIVLVNTAVESVADLEGNGLTVLHVHNCNKLTTVDLRGLWQRIEVSDSENVTSVDVGLTTRENATGELSLYKLPLLKDIKLRTGCNRLNISNCPQFVGEVTSDTADESDGGMPISPIFKPLDLGMLTGLKFLSLSGSTGLRTIPGPLPHTLRTLNLSNCPKLEHIPDDVFNAAPGRVDLQLDRCVSLRSIPAIHVASLSAQACTQLREVHPEFRAGLVSRIREDGYVVRLLSAHGDVDLGGCSSLESFGMRLVLGSLNLSGTALRELHPMRVLSTLTCVRMGSLEVVHPGTLVGQPAPGITSFPDDATVRFRYCPRLKTLAMERVYGMLDISHCTSLEEIGGRRIEVGVDLPLITKVSDLETDELDMVKPGMMRLRNCPSLRQLPEQMVCRGGLDIRYCMGLTDLSAVKLEVGWPALASIPRPRNLDYTRDETYGSASFIGCPILRALPRQMTIYGDCLLAFLDNIETLPQNALFYGHLVVTSCRLFASVPATMQVRDTLAIHTCENFTGLPPGWRFESPPALLTRAAARRLRRRRKSVQQAERRLDRSLPVSWRSNSTTYAELLLEHSAERLRQRQRAWTANSKPVDYRWLRRNTLLGGARRSISRLHGDRRRSSRLRSKRDEDELEEDIDEDMAQRTETKSRRGSNRIAMRSPGPGFVDDDGGERGSDDFNDDDDDESYMRGFAAEADFFHDVEVSSQQLAARDRADEDYLTEGTEDLEEESEEQEYTEAARQAEMDDLRYGALLHRVVLSVCPKIARIPERVSVSSLVLVNLPELAEISPDLRVDVNLYVNAAPKLESLPRTVLDYMLQQGIDAFNQNERFQAYCSANPGPRRRPSNWLARVRSRKQMPPVEPAVVRRCFMLNGTGIDGDVLRALREEYNVSGRLECTTWMPDELFQGDMGVADAVFDREEDEEDELAEVDWTAEAEDADGPEDASFDGEFESFRKAVLFWKAAATGRPPRLMRMLFESEDDYELLSKLDEVVDPAYRGSVLTFLDMLRDAREYRNPSTRRGLAERVVEVLRNVAKDEEARDELSARMADAIDACEDKPIWALNQMEVVGLIAHARGDREALRALGRRLVNLDIVHEAARRRIEQRGGFLDVDDVCVYLQYEIQFRLPLNLPVSSHFMVYGSTIPGEEVIRVSREALNLTDEAFEKWLESWPEWTRQDRFECARELTWESLPRNGKRVSLGRSTLMGDDIPDPVKLGGATYSLEELLMHWVRTGLDFSNVRHSVQDMREGLTRCDIVYVDDEEADEILSPLARAA